MSIILTEEEIAQLLNDPAVIENRAKLFANASSVSFSIAFPNTVKLKLEDHFAIDLSPLAAIPMRWVKGDTAPHRDRRGDQRSFERTCLVYLTDSVGEFVVGGERHRIEAGAAHTFREGVDHYTTRTEGERLLIGPMSESGLGVGGTPSLAVFFFTDDNFLTNESLSPKGFYYVTPIGYGSITIFNLPPPPPTTDNPNASIVDDLFVPADWTPPAGKTFGGWKFWSGTDPQFEPLDSTPSKVYQPGEVYEYTVSSVLIPNWVDAPRVFSPPVRGFHPFQDSMRRVLNRQDVRASFVEKAKVKDSSQLTQLRAMGPRQATVQTNTSAQQATKSALARVRNGGCTAPKKKTALKN